MGTQQNQFEVGDAGPGRLAGSARRPGEEASNPSEGESKAKNSQPRRASLTSETCAPFSPSALLRLLGPLQPAPRISALGLSGTRVHSARSHRRFFAVSVSTVGGHPGDRHRNRGQSAHQNAQLVDPKSEVNLWSERECSGFGLAPAWNGAWRAFSSEWGAGTIVVTAALWVRFCSIL